MDATHKVDIDKILLLKGGPSVYVFTTLFLY